MNKKEFDRYGSIVTQVSKEIDLKTYDKRHKGSAGTWIELDDLRDIPINKEIAREIIEHLRSVFNL